jgi:CubicO group peptidase (beta-lactamase class C family)
LSLPDRGHVSNKEEGEHMKRFLLPANLLACLALALAPALFSGCGSETAPTQDAEGPFVYPEDDWLEAAPEDLGMDRTRLQELQYLFEAYTPTSLLVTRKGYVVWERYYRGYSRETTFEIFSATKSFSSALAGIAVGDGLLRPDQPAADFIDQWRPPDPRSAVRIRDILTMTSGLHWYWSEYAHIGLSFLPSPFGEDLLAYSLSLPLERPPGTHWTYNNTALMTLGWIIHRATGMDIKSFADQRLFGPIGMRSVSWLTDGYGNTYTFMGIHATARDLARFGYLYLRRGRWQGRQIVPEEWVVQTTRTYNADLNPAYGYLWWVNGYSSDWQPMEGEPPTHLPKKGYFFGYKAPHDPYPAYAAMGAFGQMIAVVPGLDLVMVRTGGSELYDCRDVFDLLCGSVIR